jgi:hypothetical protein
MDHPLALRNPLRVLVLSTGPPYSALFARHALRSRFGRSWLLWIPRPVHTHLEDDADWREYDERRSREREEEAKQKEIELRRKEEEAKRKEVA